MLKGLIKQKSKSQLTTLLRVSAELSSDAVFITMSLGFWVTKIKTDPAGDCFPNSWGNQLK